ncbi:hypothetical protein VTP01DRAFT_9528 [Rhizomucor pusillus]|uniref:uncharacterized protein n=1 Tax=Rhizomucor pusillus TaxID=4840 RepID=UPI0037440E5E
MVDPSLTGARMTQYLGYLDPSAKRFQQRHIRLVQALEQDGYQERCNVKQEGENRSLQFVFFVHHSAIASCLEIPKSYFDGCRVQNE